MTASLRLVGWVLWLAKHVFCHIGTISAQWKFFMKNVVPNLHFWAVILHPVSYCVILWHLGKHGCPDDFKFKSLIWDTGWAVGSIQKRFWNQKIGCCDNWVMSKTSFPTTPGLFRGPIQAIWTKKEASSLKITPGNRQKTKLVKIG